MNESENQIVVYQPNETVRLDVRLENETVWLTQEQMSLLFGRDQSVVARHISNIFKEGELDRNAVYAKNAYTAGDGKEIFWTGASLKDAGRLTFAAAKMGAEIIPGLLASIRKATSEQLVYPLGKIGRAVAPRPPQGRVMRPA